MAVPSVGADGDGRLLKSIVVRATLPGAAGLLPQPCAEIIGSSRIRRSIRPAGISDQSDDPVESFTCKRRRNLFVDHAARARRCPNKVHSTNIAPPMSMAMSATLKIGNH